MEPCILRARGWLPAADSAWLLAQQPGMPQEPLPLVVLPLLVLVLASAAPKRCALLGRGSSREGARAHSEGLARAEVGLLTAARGRGRTAQVPVGWPRHHCCCRC